MRKNIYFQNSHTLVIDGIPCSGFAEGDYIEVDSEGNSGQRSLGGDGPSMNISVKQGGKASISLLPNSPALGPLYELRNTQALTPRLFNISVLTGVEEAISLQGCAFAKLPSFSTGGDKMQPRKFDFEYLKDSFDTSAVESIAGGLVGGLL